jgi:hypothetical protein
MALFEKHNIFQKFGAFWTTGLPEILRKAQKIQTFVWQGCQNLGFCPNSQHGKRKFKNIKKIFNNFKTLKKKQRIDIKFMLGKGKFKNLQDIFTHSFFVFFFNL